MREIFVSGYALLCLTTACDFPRPTDVPGVAVDADSDATVDAAADTPTDVSIAFSCVANEFIACDANGARICNATGDGTITQDCGVVGCNTDARRCNQCIPDTDSCGSGASEVDHCGADGLPAGHVPVCSDASPRRRCTAPTWSRAIYRMYAMRLRPCRTSQSAPPYPLIPARTVTARAELSRKLVGPRSVSCGMAPFTSRRPAP